MLSNLKIDEIDVDVLYKGDTVAWAAVVNGRKIGEMITTQDDAALVQRISEAVFAERQKGNDNE